MDQTKVHPDLIKMFKFQFTVIFSLIVLMALVPMTIMFGVFGFSSWWPFAGFKTAFFILLCLVIVLPFLFRLIAGILAQKAYDNYSYDIQEEGIEIRSGIITKTRKFIPYEKIQDLTVRQGLWERRYDLSTILIETAGAGAVVTRSGTTYSRPEGVIPGLKDPDPIMDEIRARMKKTN